MKRLLHLFRHDWTEWKMHPQPFRWCKVCYICQDFLGTLYYSSIIGGNNDVKP